MSSSLTGIISCVVCMLCSSHTCSEHASLTYKCCRWTCVQYNITLLAYSVLLRIQSVPNTFMKSPGSFIDSWYLIHPFFIVNQLHYCMRSHVCCLLDSSHICSSHAASMCASMQKLSISIRFLWASMQILCHAFRW